MNVNFQNIYLTVFLGYEIPKWKVLSLIFLIDHKNKQFMNIGISIAFSNYKNMVETCLGEYSFLSEIHTV